MIQSPSAEERGRIIPPQSTTATLSGIFASDGPLAKALPGYAPRPQQREMALAVEHALAEHQPLIIEAGTGVGKSLAYLIPCALWAARHRKTVAIATYTRALQEQLMAKDLPMVCTVLRELGVSVQAALLMGAENYLCVQRLNGCANQAQEELFETDGARQTLGQLQAWAQTAATGLRSRIPFRVPEAVWGRVRRDADLCLGRRGPAWQACLYRKDLARARQADLVVINQHLLFAGLSLPAVDALIIDEAHNLDGVAAQFLGFSLTERSVARLLDDTVNPQTARGLAARLTQQPERWHKDVEAAVGDADAAAKHVFEQIRAMLRSESGRTADVPALLPTSEQSDVIGDIVTKRIQQPHLFHETLSASLEHLAGLLEEALARSETAEQEAEIRAHLARCSQLTHQLKEFLACGNPEYAYWVEQSPARRGSFTSLHMAPLEVSERVRETLIQPNRPVILTSATLAVDGSLKAVKSQLGFERSVELLLDSPFNYTQQAAIYADPMVPDPAHQPHRYARLVIERCLELIGIVPGGTFVLFTNWRLLERAHGRFIKAKLGRRIFKQADAPPYVLLEAFRRSGNGVLLGTDTFWQGVDVPGPALSCVIITKLPFLVPDSPLEAARQERLTREGKDAFADYMLPKAVIKFRQGFGRLIRSAEDVGAVAILDPRIRTKRYGATFLASIPRCRQVESLDGLRAFFQEHAT